MRRASAAGLVLWSLVALADAQTLPKQTSKVSDFAGILTPAARADLESLLTGLEKDTTAEVVVATTASLGGMSVEEYGNRVFTEWQIGKAALDSGVLVLVAPSERQMRIEVGRGLEEVIPDLLAGAIIRDDFLPGFRDGNYEAGIRTGVRRVADLVRANKVVTAEQLAALEPSSSRRGVFDWLVFGFVGAAWLTGVVMAGTMFGLALHVRSGPTVLFGTFAAVAIVACLPIFWMPWTAFAGAPVALVAVVWGYRRRRMRGGVSRRTRSSRGWDWTFSGVSSGSDWGSSGRDSSDSGDGSSGGGASGSW